jgi:hypothetical protein
MMGLAVTGRGEAEAIDKGRMELRSRWAASSDRGPRRKPAGCA